MKHFATALLGFGIMLAALPTARAADTICGPGTHEFANTTFNGNLVVPQNEACFLIGNVTVTGNVQVQTNALLEFDNGNNRIDGNLSIGTNAVFNLSGTLTVDGNIAANQCYSILNYDGPLRSIIVGGNVNIQSCQYVDFFPSPSLDKNEIGGNFTCSNSPDCVLANTNVNGGVQFTNNSTTNNSFSDVSNNTIGGNLKCQGNGNITGGGNTVGGHETGQCANF